MPPKKALRIPLRMDDTRASLESLHTVIGRITPIPTAHISVIPESEIIDDSGNGDAQHHDEEEDTPRVKAYARVWPRRKVYQ
jgi:hypothetical protein